jgi:FRG domain
MRLLIPKKKPSMSGYWYGPYSGTNTGNIVIEIDDRGTHFECCAYAFEADSKLPSTFAWIRTSDKEQPVRCKAALLPLEPRIGEPTNWQQLASAFPDVTFPTEADVDFEWDETSLRVGWTTTIDTFGSAELERTKAGGRSELVPLGIRTWKDFKDYVNQLDHYRYIYRSQTNTWRLRTPFHRTGRADMRRFFSDDVPILHRQLSARTPHVFDLTNPLQNAAFLNLIQHHGYPTPPLDWTYSPFVGAYFAYNKVTRTQAASASDERKTRIVIFDKFQWCMDIQQILTVSARFPHFSVVEPISIGNNRIIPQQALSTFATVDDIETYIVSKETDDKKYLQAVDLPLNERDAVMRELAMMGVTAGSLFPGLDGACEKLRERFFRF